MSVGKVFITGGSGLLGSNIAKLASNNFEVYAFYNKNKVSESGVNFFQLDLTKKEDVFSAVNKINPQLIIHCAALTDVDYCEKNPHEAWQYNVLASEYVAEAKKKTGAYLIHISTDNIFDGKKGNYKETDKPNPINVYGKTKLEAEQSVLAICDDACVVRTNIYGWNKINKFSLTEWMIDKLSRKQDLPALSDVYFSPLLVNHLTNFLMLLWKIKYTGIIHVAGKQSCSKLNFAYKIADIFGFDKNLIKPINLNDLNLVAPRGKNMSFDVSKAEAILKQGMPTIEEGLCEFKRLADQGYPIKLKNE